MPEQQFVHLHNHSDYSLLDGAMKTRAMVQKAVACGQPALALTDHGNMFGAVEFYLECRKAGIKPILGMEAYVARDMHDRSGKEAARSNHTVLLVHGFLDLAWTWDEVAAALAGIADRERGRRALPRRPDQPAWARGGLVGMLGCNARGGRRPRRGGGLPHQSCRRQPAPARLVGCSRSSHREHRR